MGATRAIAIAFGLTALGAGGGAVLRAGGMPPREVVELTELPWTLADFSGRDVPVSDRVRAELRTDALLMRAYENEDAPVWTLVDYHRTQRLGATVHSPRICYPGAGWRVESADVGDIDGSPVRWLTLRRRDDARMLACYWYESRWGRTPREVGLKAAIVRSALSRRPTDAAIVRLSTPIAADDVEAARHRVVALFRLLDPRLREILPFAEDDAA
ncbi:MAG: EpsI family protein [Gemmatimonadetes bacterium]|nr:EpsI family protein [Gemmatimonadota bacterium]